VSTEIDDGSPEPDRVLVSDIDGTLLRDGEPTGGLDQLRKRLSRHRHLLRLVYATGRSFESAWSLVDGGILPRPDAMAAGVGTDLRLPPWRSSEPGYDRLLGNGWDREAILEVAERVPGLEPQSLKDQSWAKISYYASRAGSIEALRRELEALGIGARMIHSHGRFLDIIPLAAGKALAVKHLLKLWGLEDAQVLACGDSGNDRDMLAEPEFLGVAVGNCGNDLRRICDSVPGIFASSATYASGVLEGAEAHDFWP
jgi:sucrose-phosphate synthase